MSEPTPPLALTLTLDEGGRRELIRIVRVTLREYLRSGKLPPGAPHKKALLQPMPAAVRLHIGSQVRLACSAFSVEEPLYREVEHLVVQAASGAPNGVPITAEELDILKVELVLLRDAAVLSAPFDFAPARQGVVVRLGDHESLLLPREARDWDAESTLDEACRRAGLEPGQWRAEDAKLVVFEPDCLGDYSSDS